jgi:hypothetical protein
MCVFLMWIPGIVIQAPFWDCLKGQPKRNVPALIVICEKCIRFRVRLWFGIYAVLIMFVQCMVRLATAPLAKLAQGESGVPANSVRTAWVQFLPPPARSMLRAFHQAVCLPLLRLQ